MQPITFAHTEAGVFALLRSRVVCPRALLISCIVVVLGPGCAALTNPVANSLPVRRVPSELLETPDGDLVPVALTALAQPAPAEYLLAPGDVLGVFVEGVLGETVGTPPVSAATVTNTREVRQSEPVMGYPTRVRQNGTVNLPLVEPIPIAGLSLQAAQDAIRRAYLEPNKILKQGRETVLVTLMQKRYYPVLVCRQETATFSSEGSDRVFPSSKRGTGHVLDLAAYENDVLHALTLTGGLPGLDAYDEVVIFRNSFGDAGEREALKEQVESSASEAGPMYAARPGQQVIRIPLRVPACGPLPWTPADVVLRSGDVVLLEPRDDELFYTAGLLPSGEYPLPRDHELDVVEAIARVRGPLVNGAVNTNNLSGNLLAPGIGSPSPSLLVVVRRTPGGGQVALRVDLDRALVDARERIAVQAGDLLILQEKPDDALARYLTQTFVNFSLSWQILHERFATGVIDVSAPERIPGRILVPNVLVR